jgi:hypothetical protein
VGTHFKIRIRPDLCSGKAGIGDFDFAIGNAFGLQVGTSTAWASTTVASCFAKGSLVVPLIDLWHHWLQNGVDFALRR